MTSKKISMTGDDSCTFLGHKGNRPAPNGHVIRQGVWRAQLALKKLLNVHVIVLRITSDYLEIYETSHVFVNSAIVWGRKDRNDLREDLVSPIMALVSI